MKKLIVVIILLSSTVVGITNAQQKRTKVKLTSDTNVWTAQVADGFAKYCPNVEITRNESAADYVLEIGDVGDNDSPRFRFTLFARSGDVVLTTHPQFHLGPTIKHHISRSVNS